MNRPAHPYWRHYYQYNPGYWNWNSTSLFNSQYSNTAQQIYNTGYMDGVNQISNTNQYQSGGWWY
jgi:hypothetical protein